MRPWLLRPPVLVLPSVNILTGAPFQQAGAINQHQIAQARRRRAVCFQCHDGTFLIPWPKSLALQACGHIDRVTIFKRDDRPLGVALDRPETVEGFQFALADDGVDRLDLDLEQRLDGGFDLRLRRGRRDFEDNLIVFAETSVDFSVITGAKSRRNGMLSPWRASLEPLFESGNRRLRQHELFAPQDVVNVDALHRQHIDMRNVARGAANSGSISRPSMKSALVQAESS